MEKITKGHALSQSADIVKENLETLKRLFPTIVKEGKIDVEELKALLDEDIETNEEYYRFTWAGKTEARREANKPSTATLRPCKEESKNWETTGNIFIEGDNLEVLKLLQKSYAGKIKMMYFDPPYNTGKDFVYKDNYADNLGNYLSLTGQTNEEGKKLSTNTESDGRYHSNWLNMIYPRLKLAYNLLTDDGALFISIDDHEVNNLKKVCDEIFGEENFFAQLIVRSNSRGQTFKQIAKTHEYILVYTRTPESDLNELEKDADSNDLNLTDNIGNFNIRELRNRNPKFGKHNRPNLFYPIYVNPDVVDKDNFCPISLEKNGEYNFEILPLNSEKKESCWRWGKIKCNLNLNSDTLLSNLIAKKKLDGSFNIYEKYRKTTFKPKSIWDDNSFLTETGTVELRELGFGNAFDFPKPVSLIKQILNLSMQDDDIALDFFCGSATTAHAVILQNSEDGGKRKFICIQLPEITDVESEAFKSGFKNIAEISKERIRRAGEKIKKNVNANLFSQKGGFLDIGFKVFKLDSSNITAWDGSVANLEQNLFNAQKNIKSDRSEDDILYEVLLKYGLDLTVPIEEKTVHSCKVFSIGGGVLFVCLSDKITIPVAETIGKWKEELQPATCRALFKDNGFADDIAKTNSLQILRQYGIEEANSI